MVKCAIRKNRRERQPMRPDYDYVDVTEAADASFADGIPARFFEDIPEFRGGHIRRRTETLTERILRLRSVRILAAQETYERIMTRFTGVSTTSKAQKKWRQLRQENSRRHDVAANMGRWPMNRAS
jgi:hypothetical protein